jgi:hypothetical protein
MTVAFLVLAVVLIVLGALVVDGAVGTIALACGFVALFGAGVRLISRNGPAAREEGRVPAGHSGV